jgi:hypothetical protein
MPPKPIPKDERMAGYWAATKYYAVQNLRPGQLMLIVNAIIRAVDKARAAKDG